MKTKCVVHMVLLATVFICANDIFAQVRREARTQRPRNEMVALKLTDEQEQKIDEIKAEFPKTVLPLKNQLQAEKLALMALQKDNKPDENAIFAKIDEITELQADIQKKSVSQRLAIRDLLNDEQKALFDSRGRNQRQLTRAGSRQRTPMVRNRTFRLQMRPRARIIR